MIDRTFNVPDMSCGHCKVAVEGELSKIAAVGRSNADFEKGIVDVSYDEDWVSEEQLKGAIEDAGYAVTA
jgi:copper chaperone